MIPTGYSPTDIDLTEIGAVELACVNAAGERWRRVLSPGDDLSELPAEMRAAIEAHWTPERLADWQAQSAAEPEPAPGPRRIKPTHFIRRLRELGKYEAALDLVRGPGSPDHAELLSADWISEADPQVVAGLEAIGVGLEEMFGRGEATAPRRLSSRPARNHLS